MMNQAVEDPAVLRARLEATREFAQSNPEAFLDVTTGANNCCGDASPLNCCANAGFHAAKGWDPVTGLGGVDVGKLTDAWLKLP